MVTISPLKGIRYQTNDVSDLICPPYDVISKEERKKLKEKSKYNFVSIELPAGKDKYNSAKKAFQKLLRDKILAYDEKSVYIYSQKFKIDGKNYERKGILCLVRIENPAKGQIFPHEKTLLGDKKDRWNILKTLKVNTSPVFFVSHYKKNLSKLIDKITRTQKPVQIAKTQNTIHILWKISDKKIIKNFISSFKNNNLYIADGHHRYAVAHKYSQIYKTPQSQFILGFISDISDKNLLILPTHRVCAMPNNISELLKHFKPITKSEFEQSASQLPQPIKIYCNRKIRYLKLKNKNTMAKFLPDASFALRNIAPSIVKSLLLTNTPPENIFYTSSEKTAIKKATSEKKMAILLPPTPISALIKIANRREYMPQKSTYFYPKIFAGMVVHCLDEN